MTPVHNGRSRVDSKRICKRSHDRYIPFMEWEVEYTNEFEQWWQALSEAEQIDVAASVALLEKLGPSLPFPHSSAINRSRHPHMRELRVQHQGHPYRVFYAFAPRRIAILLIGGDKTGKKLFYEQLIPLADKLYTEHLQEIQGATRHNDKGKGG